MKKRDFRPNEVIEGIKIEPPSSQKEVEAINRIPKEKVVELFKHELRKVDVCVRFNNCLKEGDRIQMFLEDNKDLLNIISAAEVSKIMSVSHQHFNRLKKKYLLTQNLK